MHKDVANALQSFSFHDHLEMSAMSKLVNYALENINRFSYHSLSIVCNSLADLGVKNQALFTKIAQNLKNEDRHKNSET